MVTTRSGPASRQRVYIGTSGWSYSHWKGPFYPQAISRDQMLDYYCHRFHTVEINNTFYHLPTEHTLHHWCECVPEHFIFSVKASRYITHMKKLNDPAAGVSAFLQRISILGDKLGPILFQLPPRWRFNPQRLAAMLQALSTEFRYVFEFRDPSWINEETCSLLSRHDAAFCIYDLGGYLSPQHITTDFAYVRLHGPGAPYQGSYNKPTLSAWTDTFATWVTQGHGIYCYFDNDQAGYAVQNAGRLQAMVQDRIHK